MTQAAKAHLRLRGRRAGVIRLLVLPPAGIAALALGLEAAVRGSVTGDTLAFSSMMLAIAGLGLLHDGLRQTLVADEDGIRWSRGLRRRLHRWSDIEEIGRLRLIGADPSHPLARGPRRPQEGLGSSHIGVRLAAPSPPPASRPAEGSAEGYDVILLNDFGMPTQGIVDDLRDRLRTARAARSSKPASHPFRSVPDSSPPRVRETS